MLENKTAKILFYAKPENKLASEKNTQVEILEMTIDFEKALKVRKEFYENTKIPQNISKVEETIFYESNMPLFSPDETLARVLGSKTLNGKTISCVDSCDFVSFDYVFKDYSPNEWVENIFLPYITKNNFACGEQPKNAYIEKILNYLLPRTEKAPKILQKSINSAFQNFAQTSNNYSNILAKTLWVKDIFKFLEIEAENEARKEFVNCMRFEKKKDCTLEEITKNIVQENRFAFMSEEAQKMYARDYTRTGRILNHFARFDKNSQNNLDQTKIKSTTSFVQNNLVDQAILRFLGNKVQKGEEQTKEQTFRPIC